jgi:acyl transferase domain-containing protein
VASLRRGEPERAQFLAALGELYAAGTPIDWQRQSPAGGRFVKLPTYPWQRETYWHESEESLSDRLGQDGHPLLGQRLDGPGDVWSSALNSQYLPWLQDHRVEELVVLPGAAYVELGFALQGEVSGAHERVLENLQFHRALVIDNGKEPLVRSTYDKKTRDYAVYSKLQDHKSWALHATGKLSLVRLGQPPSVSIAEIRSRCKDSQDADTHYASMRAGGLQYGHYFQGVRELWLHPDAWEVLAKVEGHESIASENQHCMLHATLLDACFQALLATLNNGDSNVFVPVTIRQVRLWRQPGTRFWCHGYCTCRTPDSIEGDIRIFDDTGNVLVEVRGIRAQALAQKADVSLEQLADWLYAELLRKDQPNLLVEWDNSEIP